MKKQKWWSGIGLRERLSTRQAISIGHILGPEIAPYLQEKFQSMDDKCTGKNTVHPLIEPFVLKINVRNMDTLSCFSLPYLIPPIGNVWNKPNNHIYPYGGRLTTVGPMQLGPIAYRGSLEIVPTRLEIVQLLLDRGADVNLAGGNYGTALGAAAVAYEGNLEIVKSILDRGADINITNVFGNT